MIACRSTSIRSRHCQALKTAVNKDTLATGQEQADSSAAQRHNKDSTACNYKDYKDKDVMLGASNHYKLPISYRKRMAGRFRNVIAMINAPAAHRADIMIGTSSPALVAIDTKVNISGSVNLKARTWRDATNMIDANVDSARAITSSIDNLPDPPASEIATTGKVVMSSGTKFKRLNLVAAADATYRIDAAAASASAITALIGAIS